MNKLIIQIAVVASLFLSSNTSLADLIYTYSFPDGSGNASSITGTPNALFTLSAMSIGNFASSVNPPINSTSASSGYANSSGGNNIANSFIGGNFSAGNSGYIELSITNNTGLAQTLKEFDFGARSTGTGPINFTLRSSSDGFLSDLLTSSNLANSTWSFKNNATISYTIPTGSISLRLYGFGGSSAVGAINGRFDDFTIAFSDISAVPEPSSLLLVGCVSAMVLLRRRRMSPATS